MRVVAFDSPSEPDDMAGREIVGEDLLDSRTTESGIAGLDLAEQAFLGREQRSASVDVDRSAFHHDADVARPSIRRAVPIAANSSHGRFCAAGGCRAGGWRTWPSR